MGLRDSQGRLSDAVHISMVVTTIEKLLLGPSFDQEEAVALMKGKYEIVLAMFHGFDLAAAIATPPQKKTAAIAYIAPIWPGEAGGQEETLS